MHKNHKILCDKKSFEKIAKIALQMGIFVLIYVSTNFWEMGVIHLATFFSDLS